MTVDEQGIIRIQAPELRPGARADVIVLLESAAAPTGLASLDALQKSLSLDQHAARQWISRANEERKIFGTTKGR